MSGLVVFEVRRGPGGWTVAGGQWTSAAMAKAEAMSLARGMAEVVREVGQPAKVVVQDDDAGDATA